MKITKILLAESFSYPTKEERHLYKKEIPKITRLNIDYKSAFLNYIENRSINNAITEEDIYWWNLCLNNRYGKLTETYLYFLTHYNRLKKFELEKDDNTHTEDFLYDYYTEIFYYYFYSVRDIFGQLLNVLYKLDFEDDRIFLNKSFINKIPDDNIKYIFEEFLNSTSESYKKFRNAFNHRFTPNQLDNRAKSTISISDDEREIDFGIEKKISKEEFYEDCKKLMNRLSIFTTKFEEIISIK